MSPSSVLDDEDNMNRNISPRKNVVVILYVVNQHLSHISVFDMFSYYCKIFPELRGTPVVSILCWEGLSFFTSALFD